MDTLHHNHQEWIHVDGRYNECLRRTCPFDSVTSLNFATGGRINIFGIGIPSNVNSLTINNVHLLVNCVFGGLFNRDENDAFQLWSLLGSQLSNDEGGIFLLNKCQNLERLSMQGATLCLVHGDTQQTLREVPGSQAMLMKMVRLLPALRWLESDLTPENVAILQQERPEITFV